MIWIGLALGFLVGAAIGVGWVLYQLGKDFYW